MYILIVLDFISLFLYILQSDKQLWFFLQTFIKKLLISTEINMYVNSFLEYLYPVVLPVRHENVSGRIDGDALEPLELPVALAPAPEGAKEGPVGVEDLDPVVARVRHEDEPLFVDSYSSEQTYIQSVLK